MEGQCLQKRREARMGTLCTLLHMEVGTPNTRKKSSRQILSGTSFSHSYTGCNQGPGVSSRTSFCRRLLHIGCTFFQVCAPESSKESARFRRRLSEKVVKNIKALMPRSEERTIFGRGVRTDLLSCAMGSSWDVHPTSIVVGFGSK